jgi:SAM-dependent methyltransferase
MIQSIPKLLAKPATENEIRKILNAKRSLQELYKEVYVEYAECIKRSKGDGQIIECGSGVGFANEIIPNIITSDIVNYSNVDVVLDATNMPLEDNSASAILMHNVFHHIPDVERFLMEAERCLRSGGRILIADQNPGILVKYIFRYLHSEPFNEKAESWSFPSNDPVNDANGALAWIVFVRDHEKLQRRHPNLRLVNVKTHTPLRYWLYGGLKKWSLLPEKLFPLATWFDRTLLRITPRLGSFAFYELEKIDIL